MNVIPCYSTVFRTVASVKLHVILDSIIAHNSVVLKLNFMSFHAPQKSVQSPYCYHHTK